MRNFAVFFPNTDLIVEVIANGWEMPDVGTVTFFKGEFDLNTQSYKNQKITAVFNMNNIAGFREIED